jgi:restriction system protein
MVKLSPTQMMDFIVLWVFFLNVIFFLFFSMTEINILALPELLLIFLVTFAIYLPFRLKRMNLEKKELEKVLQSGISEIDLMDGIKFEHYLEALFRTMGYNVQTTSTSGDFGADLILKKDNRTIAVQVKRYNKTVGVKAVQEVYSAIPYYGATEAWVVTNNTFSKPAYELAEKSNIFLIDRGMLIEMIINYKTAAGS